MEREEGLLHLHTDRFLLFLCVLGQNLNLFTCPSIHLSSHPLHFNLSLVSVPCSLSPHLYAAHRAITTSRYHTISVSLHLFHYLCVLLPLLTYYCILFVCICVCLCNGITHPEAPFCTDIGMLWTLVLNSKASHSFYASWFSLHHLHINVCAV